MASTPGYSYAQLAGRISAVLQVSPPSLSTLRAAAAEARRTPGTKRHVRLTLGMPAPSRAGGRAVFDQAAVEAWLAGHPWLSSRQAAARLRGTVAAGGDLQAAVAEAREDGLSWRAIADTFAAAGVPRSAQALHRAFRPGRQAVISRTRTAPRWRPPRPGGGSRASQAI